VGSAWLFAFLVTGLGLGGLWALALGLWAHHAGRARVARFARSARAGASRADVREGAALLGGVVTVGEDLGARHAAAAPALRVAHGAPPARGQYVEATPFVIAMPSGVAIRVEPEPGRWSLDATFVAADGAHGTVYEAVVRPGDELYVRGTLQREHDPRVAGRGYRDLARAWVLRGDLAFCSAAVVKAHAARAAFHRGWALTLGVAFAGLSGLLASAHARPAASGARGGVVAVIALGILGAAYAARAEATTPWVRRKVLTR
jgi:hypothetical protein